MQYFRILGICRVNINLKMECYEKGSIFIGGNVVCYNVVLATEEGEYVQ